MRSIPGSESKDGDKRSQLEKEPLCSLAALSVCEPAAPGDDPWRCRSPSLGHALRCHSEFQTRFGLMDSQGDVPGSRLLPSRGAIDLQSGFPDVGPLAEPPSVISLCLPWSKIFIESDDKTGRASLFRLQTKPRE